MFWTTSKSNALQWFLCVARVSVPTWMFSSAMTKRWHLRWKTSMKRQTMSVSVYLLKLTETLTVNTDTKSQFIYRWQAKVIVVRLSWWQQRKSSNSLDEEGLEAAVCWHGILLRCIMTFICSNTSLKWQCIYLHIYLPTSHRALIHFWGEMYAYPAAGHFFLHGCHMQVCVILA